MNRPHRGRVFCRRRRRKTRGLSYRPLVLAITVLAALTGRAGDAFGLLSGLGIANTSTSSPTDQLVDPAHLVRRLAVPFAPGDNDPKVVAELGWPGTPENDLAAALDALGAAADNSAAARARSAAIDILEGNPITGRAYSGIPLLNWNAPAKVKRVPAGGNVVVAVVRYGDHTLSDTSLLDFEDPTRPFTITYRVSELDPSGVLAPTPLLVDHGRPAGGLHAVAVPLVLPDLLTGTRVTNRFHPEGGAEHTRVGTQELTVAMPPAGSDAAILLPDLRPGHTSLASLAPATPERLAHLHELFGFAGATPTRAERSAAIARLGEAAPEKILWTDLQALDPAAPGFLAAARALGAQDRQLVAALRSRAQLPNGVNVADQADLTVVFLNDEAYVSARSLRLAPGAPLRLALANADGFAHRADVVQLANRDAVYGALDWGRFDWSPLRAGDGAVDLAAGESRRVMLTPAPDTFELLIGDPGAGDQAGVAVALERGPDRQSIRIRPDFATPAHDAIDARGDVWVTLEGVDKVIRLTPAADLATSRVEEYLLPGGVTDFASRLPRQGPHDVAIDPDGIVWVTLADGNGIARLDPTLLRSGTSAGITAYFLDECPLCMPPFPTPAPPPAPQPDPPSRVPDQMALLKDGDGNTVVWFSELAANAIGVLRVAPDGSRLAYTDFPCGCRQPKGIALATDGSVWFTEELSNRLGRLVPGQSRPLDIGAATIEHFPIPSGVDELEPTPSEPNRRIRTSRPHSLVFDGAGRLWFSEEETRKMAFLDLARARPGTSEGIVEFDLPRNDFHARPAPADLAVDRAGTVFFTDEYGDEVGTITAAGPGPRWRPTERQSLTDEPALDQAGNLWFTEAGANLVTRIAGVSAGAPAPAAPPLFVADPTDATLTGTGLRGVDTVDVVVAREGRQIAGASGVRVAGGSFTVGAGGAGWTGAADPPLAAGDVVTVTGATTVSSTATVVIPPPPPPPVRRVAGETREQTAIAASRTAFADAADAPSTRSTRAGAVVLSRSDAFADALAGVPLAAAEAAPLLLTPPDHLDPDVHAEIERVLGAGGTVYVLGGPAALDRSIDRALAADGHAVVRLAGADRYQTAVRVAEAGAGHPATVLLATGRDFADALAGGPAAARAGGAILLTDADRLPDATRAYLEAHPTTARFALGGPAALADPDATPLVGRDRYDTAALIGRAFFGSPGAVGVVSGERFPDALSGGADLARRGAPLLLAPAGRLPAPSVDYVAAHRSSIADGVLYGGTAALTDSVAAALRDALTSDDTARTVLRTTSSSRPLAPLSFTVATLGATVTADGTVTGKATSRGNPLAGRVRVTFGSTSADAPIDPRTGAFTASPPPGADLSTRGAVTWSSATVGGVFRTRSVVQPGTAAATTTTTTTTTTEVPR